MKEAILVHTTNKEEFEKLVNELEKKPFKIKSPNGEHLIRIKDRKRFNLFSWLSGFIQGIKRSLTRKLRTPRKTRDMKRRELIREIVEDVLQEEEENKRIIEENTFGSY